VEEGVGHKETAGINRVVRNFMLKWLKGEEQAPGVAAALNRSIRGALQT
jgi:hypothetical protein